MMTTAFLKDWRKTKMINDNINKEFLKYTDIALEKLHSLNYEND